MSLLSDLINLNLSETTESIIAEYIWIGGSGMDLRSKGKTISGPVTDPHKLPKWNYDGSSTGQAPGEDSEVILYPQAIFKDPFRRGNNILVMCDCYTPAGEPIPTNKRFNAAKIFSHPDVSAEVPWYGIEQEYTLLQKDVKWPLGWPVGGFPGPQVFDSVLHFGWILVVDLKLPADGPSCKNPFNGAIPIHQACDLQINDSVSPHSVEKRVG